MNDTTKLPRPSKALTLDQYSNLEMATKLYPFIGVWPFSNEKNEGCLCKVSQVMLFKEHRDYSEIHHGQNAHKVFDTAYVDDQDRPSLIPGTNKLIKTKHFADYWNLIDNQTSNSYLFLSQEDVLECQHNYNKLIENDPTLKKVFEMKKQLDDELLQSLEELSDFDHRDDPTTLISEYFDEDEFDLKSA